MTRYVGTRTEKGVGAVGEATVVVRSGGKAKPLAPRLDLFNHSPAGFNWGYSGSGPAQLALAILAHHLAAHPDDVAMIERAVHSEWQGESWRAAERAALGLHQDFKAAAIAGLPSTEDFELTESQVSQTIAALCAARGQS